MLDGPGPNSEAGWKQYQPFKWAGNDKGRAKRLRLLFFDQAERARMRIRSARGSEQQLAKEQYESAM
jgi:hypothetical protein